MHKLKHIHILLQLQLLRSIALVIGFSTTTSCKRNHDATTIPPSCCCAVVNSFTQDGDKSSNDEHPTFSNFINSTYSKQPKRSLHLISLPSIDNSYSLPGESLVRKCWKWKDSVLGDGRDYFVPRPKSLKEFQSLFVGMEICIHGDWILQNNNTQEETIFCCNNMTLKQPQSSDVASLVVEQQLLSTKQFQSGSVSNEYIVEECVTLSNCARFEMLVVLKSKNEQYTSHTTPAASSNIESKMAETASKLCLAYQLFRQTENYQSNTFLQRSGLASWIDLPNVILKTNGNDVSPPNTVSMDQSKAITQLEQRLTCINGHRPISKHLSLIASGLAPRTNRPDREVVFRPYSSRDAHILLQLKRTAEVISSLDVHDTQQGGRSRGQIIKTLLDCALSAGKAARNERIVPDIRQLKEFGSDGTPPVALANIVAEAAIRLAVNPAVDKCVERLKAAEASNQISLLREHTNNIVDALSTTNNKQHHQTLQKMANTLLHAPTMKLREGRRVSRAELEDMVHEIELELKVYCCKLKSTTT